MRFGMWCVASKAGGCCWVYVLNHLRRSRSPGFGSSRRVTLRPKTSLCHILGEPCPCLFVVDFTCFCFLLFVFHVVSLNIVVFVSDSNSGAGFLLFYNIAEASVIKRFIE